MNSTRTGQSRSVEETTDAAEQQAGTHADEPVVTSVSEGDTMSLTVAGELTEAARRPLVRAMTEALLSGQSLTRAELRLAGVTFMNSPGLAVLVQLQRMAAPRGIEVALVAPPPAVARPLQLSGLWHRFPVVDENGAERPAEVSPEGPDGSPRDHA
ncbi:STAS domain-containing protein [Candidatus Blastococcus massiliensis]|uniref:STAS domain-containing protein n=1 Tax=Candidatus Blastococcus massiliensis TaxID=1470358 RepID=UPI001E59D55E|nr:STAS domain-containing protein [Candidatus Blastococcus massiliensis]